MAAGFGGAGRHMQALGGEETSAASLGIGPCMLQYDRRPWQHVPAGAQWPDSSGGDQLFLTERGAASQEQSHAGPINLRSHGRGGLRSLVTC